MNSRPILTLAPVILGIAVFPGSLGAQHLPAQPTSADYKQVGKEFMQAVQSFQQLEASVYAKQSQYAQSTLDELAGLKEDLETMVVEVLSGHPPDTVPSPEDILKLAVDLGQYGLETAQSLVTLQETANEADLQLLKANADLAKLQQAENANHPENPPENPDGSKPPPLLPVQPVHHAVQPPNSANLDDAIDILCFQDFGDRCFDGQPQKFADFLARHPEYKKADNAAVYAPGQSMPPVPHACSDYVKQVQSDTAQMNALCSTFSGDTAQMCWHNWGFLVKSDQYALNKCMGIESPAPSPSQ